MTEAMRTSQLPLDRPPYDRPARRRPKRWHGAGVIAVLLFWLAGAAQAALTIDIVGGASRQIPIAILPFNQELTQSQAVSEIIRADLTRSGLFRAVDTLGAVPIAVNATDFRYPEWRGRGADALVVGEVAPAGGGQLQVSFRLLDVAREGQLAGASYTVPAAELRGAAHKIADVIYEKLTGDVGVFSTRIAYVLKQGNRFELQVSDYDGFNPQTVVSSNQPIISPAWSPDGGRLAYVSFERKKPIVYVQNLVSGQRQAVAAYRGSNSAPAWSPSGGQLAVVLSQDGDSEIYLTGANGGGARRLTFSGSIDTEPTFSPDGGAIYFTSDRGGSPQIYRMAAGGGEARRVTFEGDYNTSPSVSPDGKALTFLHRAGGQFYIAIQELQNGDMRVLTNTAEDESPTFAPNGKMVLYATRLGRRGILAAVSSDGSVKQQLKVTSGDVREPAWGPLPRAATRSMAQ